jgi:U3 small nucleolar RNA-associated protein 22
MGDPPPCPERSARWPDGLAAIETIKLAFFVGIANALRDQDNDIHAVVALDSDVSEAGIHDNCALEVLTPFGFAFRFRVYHDREKALLDGIISDSKAAPGVLVAAKDALRVHEMPFIHAARHYAAVAALTHQLPLYAPTVRGPISLMRSSNSLFYASFSNLELLPRALRPHSPA